MEKTIKLARYRTTPYTHNHVTNGGTKKYEWAGATDRKVDVKAIPEEVFDWMTMNSVCFSKGELVIVEEDETLVENIVDVEEYKNNTHTKDEITKILQGNLQKMKKELEKITVDSEKKFVLSVAQELKEDLAQGKVKFLSEWLGVSSDVLND